MILPTLPIPTTARIILACLMVFAALGIGGCASTQTRPATDYVTLYQSGRYSESYDAAAAAAAKGSTTSREEAALIAGLSAQALDRHNDAKRWLNPLLDSPHRGVSGRAAAALGLVAKDTRDFAGAATLLEQASRSLEGDEAARAAIYAGDCHRTLGRSADAQRNYQKARDLFVSDAQVRMLVADRLGTTTAAIQPQPVTSVASSSASPRTNASMGVTRTPASGYTVQFGAFSSRDTAQKQASKVAYQFRGVPLRIVTVQAAGKTLYAVRTGRYPTRAEAERAAIPYGKIAVATTATGE